MTAISACTELLLDPGEIDLSPDAAQMVGVVQRHSHQVLHIINELLDLAALESGHAAIDREPCDLAAPARSATGALHATAAAAGLTIEARLPGACPVHGDPHRLRQVIDTLLGNAIAYSPDGGRITVTAAATGGVAELAVTDPGIGIPAGEREQLFGRFYHSSRTWERRIPGAGPAPAVSRAIVERHDGSIRLLPGQGPGTTVQVRLPAA
ncbi:sensor histidine kinase [Actinoplanes sp. CA-142083]|uniref:sensor histidine kinase n=1 Tax=Actinoplanes sp. CA-142083 TaxID=3239903 RepID=UPI003D8E0EB2